MQWLRGLLPKPAAAREGYADALGAWAIQVEWVKNNARPTIISDAQARAALTAYLPAGSRIVLADAKYSLLSARDFDHLRTGSPLPQIRWTPDSRDCDDFAQYFAAACALYCRVNCVAVVWDTQASYPDGRGNSHAYNLVLLADGEGRAYCRALEPQTMRWIWPGTDGLLVKPVEVRL